MDWFKKNIFPILIILIVALFHHSFILKGNLPIPSDTILGMYHPFRDNIWNGFTNGVPFKNPLITDPVRQQFVWRELAISQIKSGQLPLWNPYSFSGTPLLANFQASVFYPMNILFFFLPHEIAWSLGIIASQLLAGLFLYCFLRNIGISQAASFIGSIAFSFSGFTISWLEWNTILHVSAWTILALLSVDKIIQRLKTSDQRPISWYLVFTLSLIFAFFAGHLQIFFYGLILIGAYILFRFQTLIKNKIKIALIFVSCFLLFFIITLPQSIPTFNFINQSSRDLDQTQYLKEGWFIPWQNLVQFIIPDFFGNPATGNYFGVWNYAEFVGFIGIIPFIFALLALIFSRLPVTLFFGSVLLISLIFALPTPIAKIPFFLDFPLISTSQPTRLLFLAVFSLSVLSGLGFDYFLKNKNSKNVFFIILPLLVFIIFFWFFASNPVTHRNLIFPSVILLGSLILFILFILVNTGKIFSRSKKLISQIVLVFIIIVTVSDLLRFSWKFTPFTNKEWLFPDTQIIKILKNDVSRWRMISLDRRIMPSNFSTYYRFQDVAGYDPLYFKSYNLLVSSWNSGKPETVPGSFNRIVTPDNLNSFIAGLLNVKYVLSYGEVESENLNLLANEGMTYLYQNKNFFPRAWLADGVLKVQDSREELVKIFELKDNLRRVAVTSEDTDNELGRRDAGDRIDISYWSDNKITIKTHSESSKILVLSEIYSPIWNANVDGKKTKILKVNFLLRGIALEKGEHIIEFYSGFL